MASSTQWMWVWVNYGSWWWTERPGMLRFMGSQRVGYDWATELNWTELNYVPGIFPGCRDSTGNKTYNVSILLEFNILGKNINYLHLGRLSINIYQENKKFRKTGLWVHFFSHFSLLKYCFFVKTQLKYQGSYFSSSISPFISYWFIALYALCCVHFLCPL